MLCASSLREYVIDSMNIDGAFLVRLGFCGNYIIVYIAYGLHFLMHRYLIVIAMAMIIR